MEDTMSRMEKIERMMDNDSEYLDIEEEYDDYDEGYKKTVKFQKTNRKIFAKKKSETVEHIDNQIDRSKNRNVRKNQKEAFIDGQL